MRNFWGLLWQSFQEINGTLLSFLGIVVSLLAWFISKDTKIGIIWLIIIVIISLIVIWTLLHGINKLLKENRQLNLNLQTEKDNSKNLLIELEKIRIPRILSTTKQQNTDLIICLLEKSEYLGVESLLSFYYLDSEGFEVLIGIGYVKDIRVSDGKIQAMIHKPESSYQDILDKLGNNDSNVIKNTFVKPTILNSFLK